MAPTDVPRLLPDEGGKSGWDGFPFDARDGEGPRPGDTPPERTPDGGFVFYCASSSSGAASIMIQHRIAPDNLGVVRLATTLQGGADYAATKGAGPRLRVVVTRDKMALFIASHEPSGNSSGSDQFLIRLPHGQQVGHIWLGLPLKSVQVITPGRPAVTLKTKLSINQRYAVKKYTEPGGSGTINDPLRAGTPLTVNALDDDYQTVRHLDAAIAKSVVATTGTVYRGVARQPGDVPWKTGDVLPPDPGYTSASGDPTMAEQFAILRSTGGAPGTGLLGVKYDPTRRGTGGPPVTLAIHLREGQHALEGDPSVDELLLGRGAGFTVTGIRRVTIPTWQRQPYFDEPPPPPATHEAELVDVELTEPDKPPPLPTLIGPPRPPRHRLLPGHTRPARPGRPGRSPSSRQSPR